MRLWLICLSLTLFSLHGITQTPQSEFIKVADDNWHFETTTSGTPFTPFGANYYDPASF
jgi:hypothetical protein